MRTFLRRIRLQISANRRQFSVLCAGLAVALLLWARLIIVGNMPRTAMALPEPASKKSSVAPSDKRTSPGLIQVELHDRPQRDPFQISHAHYPRTVRVDEIRVNPPKSDREPVENSAEVEANLRRQLQMLVDAMSLDAVMPSASLAVINGQTVGIDQTVRAGRAGEHQFLLVEVRQRSVTLEYEGRRFELNMRRPVG